MKIGRTDYDSAWNLTNRTVNTTPHTFQVDGLNQLTNSTPGGVSAYDGNGNLVSSGATALEYAYDDENRLSIVQSNTVFYSTNYPLWQTLYAYDGLGRLRLRVERQNMVMPDPGGGGDSLVIGEETTLESGAGVTWSTNSITRYVYDSWRVIQERNGSNNVPTVSYTRGTDLSGTLEGAGGIGGLLARSHGYSSGNWSTHNFYHADGNGNVTYLVAANQGQAARYRYDPYGNVISLAENLGFLGTPNTYRFSSKMVDLKTGLYYYGYRWYSQNLQRWVNRDPIDELGFMLLTQMKDVFSMEEEKNLYAFVLNNPVTIVDMYGLRGFWKSKWFPWNWPLRKILPPYDLPPGFPGTSPPGKPEPGFQFKPWKPSCTYNFNEDWSIQGTYNPNPNPRDPYDREPENTDYITIRLRVNSRKTCFFSPKGLYDWFESEFQEDAGLRVYAGVCPCYDSRSGAFEDMSAVSQCGGGRNPIPLAKHIHANNGVAASTCEIGPYYSRELVGFCFSGNRIRS